MHLAVGLFSLLLVLLILWEAFEVMLLPRTVQRRGRLVVVFFRSSWRVWSGLARRFEPSAARQTYLSIFGPISMLILFMGWAVGLVTGFGLLHWAAGSGPMSVVDSFYLSGSSFFTLGSGDVRLTGALGKVGTVMEAGVGFGFIAVVIGYLPVLYQLFSRREAQVIQFDARAGSPPTATRLLLHHAAGHDIPELYQLLKTWEHWCAELLESHISYPMLSYYRSQYDNQSWLAALTTMLDSSALMLVGFKGVKTFQASMSFAMARLAVTQIAQIFHLNPSRASLGRLSTEGFATMSETLSACGLDWSDPEQAEHRLAEFRSTYEPFLECLAEYLLLPLPPWYPAPGQTDNWTISTRGRLAERLVESVAPEPE